RALDRLAARLYCRLACLDSVACLFQLALDLAGKPAGDAFVRIDTGFSCGGVNITKPPLALLCNGVLWLAGIEKCPHIIRRLEMAEFLAQKGFRFLVRQALDQRPHFRDV